MPLRLRVTYGRSADFFTDVEQQVSKRGLLVRIEVPPNCERGEAIQLEIVTPAGKAVIPASLLQPLPGLGIAVEVDPEAFEGLVDLERRNPTTSGLAPRHDRLDAAAGPAEAAARATRSFDSPPVASRTVSRLAGDVPPRAKTDPPVEARTGTRSSDAPPSPTRTTTPRSRPPAEARTTTRGDGIVETRRPGTGDPRSDDSVPVRADSFETRTPARASALPSRPPENFETRTPPRATGIPPAKSEGAETRTASWLTANPTTKLPEDFETRTPPRPTTTPAAKPPENFDTRTQARLAAEAAAKSPENVETRAPSVKPETFETRTPTRTTALPSRPPESFESRTPPRASASPIVEKAARVKTKDARVDDDAPPAPPPPARAPSSPPIDPTGDTMRASTGAARAPTAKDDGDSAEDDDHEAGDPAGGPAGGVEEAAEPDDNSEGAEERKATHAQLQAQKIQQALHGDKNQRMAILREPNRLLHGYVLRNPQLQLEEVTFIARMSAASAEILTQISNRREWAERPEVAIALVRNPKTPIPVAVRMLDHVGMGELRNLAKQQNVRDQIQRAARKKVIG